MQNDNGVQKGIKTILTERDLWREGLKLNCKENCPKADCCARAILSAQPDFVNERNWLQTVVEERGHSQIFLPKFHCELNFIEMVRGYTKAALRKNASFALKTCELTFLFFLTRFLWLLFDEFPDTAVDFYLDIDEVTKVQS